MPGDDALREIAAAIGDEAALSLARQLGGTTVYVPRTIGDDHPLCVAIGRTAADALAGWMGGSALAVPKQAERRARVLDLHRRRSLSIAQIALETGYSQRHVLRLLAAEHDSRQPDLFA